MKKVHFIEKFDEMYFFYLFLVKNAKLHNYVLYNLPIKRNTTIKDNHLKRGEIK